MLHPHHNTKKNLVVFTKKQDPPGVPKIVKNDPEMFLNSFSISIVLSCFRSASKNEKYSIYLTWVFIIV